MALLVAAHLNGARMVLLWMNGMEITLRFFIITNHLPICR